MLALLDTMDQFGWATLAGAFGDADSLRLRQECEAACQRGEFKRARVGKGINLEVRDEVRRDQVLWIKPGEGSTEQQHYLDKVETLRLLLNQRFFLGLFDFESHFAIYPEGGFYRPHLDQHTGTRDRIVTVILYLNPNWQPGDGGELKLWTNSGTKTGAFTLIEPRMGTVVCFMSGDFWHEVLPAKHIRMSVSGWFRQR